MPSPQHGAGDPHSWSVQVVENHPSHLRAQTGAQTHQAQRRASDRLSARTGC